MSTPVVLITGAVTGILVTTEAMITELPKKETPPAMPPGGMDY